MLFAVGLARRGHGFGRDVFGTFELVVAVIAGGQGTYFVDHVHQHLRAVSGQALTGHTVFCEHFFAGFHGGHEGLGVLDVTHAFGAPHGNGLEVFAAHHGAHARSASSAVQIIHHAGKQHAVFPGLADAGHAGQRVLQTLLEHLFSFPDALAPQVGGIAQFHHIVVDVQVDRLGRLAFKNQHVPTGHLELGTPVAT